MTTKLTEAKRIWNALIDEYTLNMLDNLKRVKFNKDGTMKPDRYGTYAFHHFPNFIKEWKKRIKEMGDGSKENLLT